MKIIILFSALLAAASLTQVASASPELAKSKNCMSCHAPATKLVGPSFKDIASKYRKDPNAPAQLAQKIQNGSQGIWGSIPMPPNSQLTAEDAMTLSRWILGQ
ncbi:c-type cytochrome [Herbaspirillum frisingense]|uniref:c-type cytochrome n=1 Tax=Herbaspirillum frisingense TaxID=92645 RepID=UPI0016047732|nr:c-type cytochrome [Herbaspirillum frisingense]QNB06719.1 c-type cytochrome [Herbaspirillum frisingense]